MQVTRRPFRTFADPAGAARSGGAGQRGGTVADHQLERQAHRSRGLACDDRQQKLHRGGPHLGAGLTDRGQRGNAGLGKVNVIKTDDRHISRHPLL